MNKINCTGKDGIPRIFNYRYSHNINSQEWNFNVETDPPPESLEFFEIRVKQISPKEVRVIAMYHNDEPAYMAAGIPDTLLPLIRDIVGISVCSSPTDGQGNVYRTQAATKVWNRLVKRGIAVYKENEDVFCIP